MRPTLVMGCKPGLMVVRIDVYNASYQAVAEEWLRSRGFAVTVLEALS